REAVLMYEANRRSGTASTKSRAEVRASGRKPYRQKGTGYARRGTTVGPMHVGGGVAHGPKPRSFRYRIPRKVRRAALRSALLDKLQTATRVIDRIQLDAPKTRRIARLLEQLGVEGSCLIADSAPSDAVVKSVRNIPDVRIKRMRDVNAHDLLLARSFVVTRRALEEAIERLAVRLVEKEG
ncbi:MAG: 50S ribosomal protein L4, partial [Planctomycetota bacterium]